MSFFSEKNNVNLNQVKTQLAQIANKPFRFICTSDIHKDEGEGIGGLTSAERMQQLVNDLIEEDKKRKLDAVFILGDLSLNNKQATKPDFPDGVKFVKENVVDKLPFPVYCLHGNHDSYTEEKWVNLFGYPKNFDVQIGDFVFLCYDTFGSVFTGADGISERTFIDNVKLKEKMDFYQTEGKKVFVFTHWLGADQGNPIDQRDIDTFQLLSTYDNFIACVQGHDHSFNSKVEYGSKVLQDGAYSYDFTAQPKWGYRNFEYYKGALKTEKVLVDFNYGDYQQSYTVSNKEMLIGSTFIEGREIPLFMNETIDKQNIEFVKAKTLEILNSDLFQDLGTTTTMGLTAAYQNNSDDLQLADILLFGKTAVSTDTPSFEAPATITENDINFTLQSSNNIGINTVTPLRSVPNTTFYDKVSRNTIYRKVARKTLNGTENWLPTADDSPTHIRFYFETVDGDNSVFDTVNNIYCNKLRAKPLFNTLRENEEAISFAGGSNNRNISIKVLKTRLNGDLTATGFKAFLVANNVEVLYPIVEKTESLSSTIPTLKLAPTNTITADTTATNKPNISISVLSGLKSHVKYLIDLQDNKNKLKDEHRLNVIKGAIKTFGYIYADTFGGVDGTAVASGTSDSGNSFTVTGTMGTSDFALVNTGATAANYETTLGVNNYEFEVCLGKTSNDKEITLVFCKKDDSNQLKLSYATKTGKLEYKETIAGTSTSFWTIDLKYTAEFVKDSIVKVRCDASNITITLNGAEIYKTTRKLSDGKIIGVRLGGSSDNSIQSICARALN